MLGARVAHHRRRLALTQEELADRTGLSVRTIRRLEAGEGRVPRTTSLRLLADAFALAGAEREAFLGGGAAALPAPAQLPPDIAGFSGRAADLARLDALASPGEPAVIAVSGSPGVGKTALAVHWAHTAADRFPDGQLYLDLRGFGPAGAAMNVAEAVRTFLQALGVPAAYLPDTIEGQTALYRSVASGRRLLVVLDNAQDAEHVRPLLPTGPGSAAVVTSRRRLTGLVAHDGAEPLDLGLPSAEAGLALLAGRLGTRPAAAERAAAAAVVTACARLPLALVIVAARVRCSGASLTTVAAELAAGGPERLDALDGGEPASRVRSAFSWSVAALEPAAAGLFRRLGLHPGTAVGLPAASSLAGEPAAAVRRRLTDLVQVGLVGERPDGRYVLHDLVHLYAADLARAEPAPARAAAVRRVLDHYLHTAIAADRRLAPFREPIGLPPAPPAPGATLEPIPDRDAAQAWFAGHDDALLGAVHLAAAEGLDEYTLRLSWSLFNHLGRRGRWHDLAAIAAVAVAAAGRLDHPLARPQAEYLAAYTDQVLGRFAAAHRGFTAALAGFAAAGHEPGLAMTHKGLTLLYDREDQPAAALHHGRRALAFYQGLGDRHGAAHSHNAIGWSQARLGDHTGAEASCRTALTLFEALADSNGLCNTWDSVGYLQHRQGHYAEAVASYRRALHSARAHTADRHCVVDLLDHLADSYTALNRPTEAAAVWSEALDILDDIDVDPAVRRALAGKCTPPQ
ncbi:helix-turn-helix domain-containing protein [Dactylosporangium sp. NPDC051541]|uniref:helix-turn-helix domain-containing protein n=1 Tax=Dactylosporangium sp. NPDC051541 TaxID=3363977 RepID=UPI00379F65DD